MKRQLIGLGLSCSLFLAGCVGALKPPTKVEDLPPLAQDVVQSQLKFGFDLVNALGGEEENLFISPTSIQYALAMTYNGATGETKEAMAKALGFDGIDIGILNQGALHLQALLTNPDPQVKLELANAIWYRDGLTINKAFKELNEEFYKAAVKAADFDDPKTVKEINDWVEKQTNGRIKDLVGELKADDMMHLINTLYFYGQWQEPFNEKLTRPLPFTLANGSQRQVPMMSQGGAFRYLQQPGFEAVALPYGKEGKLSLYAFRPEGDLASFLGGLTPEAWLQWQQQFQRKEGSVTLPKLKLEYSVSLVEALSQLGMGIAFEPGNADFSGLFDGVEGDKLFITNVAHKSFLEMNEKGTEAAAATDVAVGVTSAPAPTERFDLTFDKPYFIAIVDEATQTLLFTGAIYEPEQ